ncbi:MAG: peptidoglycan bridge formation glycyltransferase FemA/FemB family protein [Candidatus Shapirobacteria bacterium]
MEIKEISQKAIWEKFVQSQEDYTFLQGWNWGEINKTTGEKLFRLGLYDQKNLIGICQVFTISARRGKFLFVPHGPILKSFSQTNLKFVFDYLKKLAKTEKVDFIRISPWLESTEKNKKIYKNLGFKSAPIFMHAEETWLIDIDKDENTLLSEMRKTTRNLISRATRDGVEIIKSTDPKDIKYLYDLQLETSKRNHFVPFSKKILELELNTFGQDNQCLLFLGKHNKIITGAAIIIFYGKFVFYYQSGSVENKVPINYLLQWEVIKEAKSRGCKIYNMWGIAPPNVPNHPWIGLTTFKTGFGGFNKNYLHAQDLILSPKYYLTYIIEKIPKTLRAKFR